MLGLDIAISLPVQPVPEYRGTPRHEPAVPMHARVRVKEVSEIEFRAEVVRVAVILVSVSERVLKHAVNM